MNLNKVFIIGNLTRDVNLRSTPSGRSVADFGVATNRVWVDASGQKQQEVEFHNIVVWGKMAELCSQYLAKGRLVLVEGRIRTRTWQDSSNQKKIKTEIIAQNIQFGPRWGASSELKMPSEEEGEFGVNSVKEDLPILEEDEGEINPEEIPF